MALHSTPNANRLDYHQIYPFGMFWTSVFGMAAFFISLVVLRVLRFFWRCTTSPLHQLPGPVSTSWLYGNVREFTEAGQSVLWDHWTEIYGNTFKFSTFFNVSPCLLRSVSGYVIDRAHRVHSPQTPALYTMDACAMNYILAHQDEFMKPMDIKIALTLLGEGTTRSIASLGSRWVIYWR